MTESWDGLSEVEQRMLHSMGGTSAALEHRQYNWRAVVAAFRAGYDEALLDADDAVGRAVRKGLDGLRDSGPQRLRALAPANVPPRGRVGEVLDAIRADVEKLPSGRWLVAESAYMEQLKASRGTVRSAMKRLEREGVIAVQMGRGRYKA